MESERWRQISQLYEAALRKPVPDRVACVRDACRNDDSLRPEVESLLAQSSSSGHFLSNPAAGLTVEMMPREPSLTGRRISAYEIQNLLGGGGMGEVYQAHDPHLRRDVAIKILPQVFTTDPERVARFEREARMLAALNHPNIPAIHSVEHVDNAPRWCWNWWRE